MRNNKKILGALGLVLSGALSAHATNYFFSGTGSLSAANWSTTGAAPYSTSFVSGGTATFGVAGTFAGASITVAKIVATANMTGTSAGGTISNTGNGVISIDVANGVTLDFGTQSFTTAAGAGYIKDNSGILALAGNTYGGGFTINDGAVVARGVNAFGSGATGVLTINSGTIAANATRDFSGKYAGITVGGDFTLGALASSISISSSTANLTFNAATNLGAVTRKVTIGANGVYTLSGVISGSSGAGLTVDALSGATGKLTLTNVNTYSGSTTINAGTLVLSGTGTAGTGDMKLNGGKLDLSAYTGNSNNYALGSSQSLLGSGTVTGATGKTISVAGKLSAGSAGAGTITLDTIALTLSGTSTFDFTNTSLALGTYDLVNGTTGTDSVTFGGSLVLNFSGGTYADGTVKIFDLDSYSGSFSSLSFSGLSVGQSATFDSSTGIVTIATIPEPGTTAMALGSLGAMFWVIRRKRTVKA